MWALAFFIGVLFGYVVCALLSVGESEAESFWENLYTMEKDSHAGTQKLLDEYKLKEKGVAI